MFVIVAFRVLPLDHSDVVCRLCIDLYGKVSIPSKLEVGTYGVQGLKT